MSDSFIGLTLAAGDKDGLFICAEGPITLEKTKLKKKRNKFWLKLLKKKKSESEMICITQLLISSYQTEK